MIKGILFDKDGTLIDFFSLWLQAAYEVIPELLQINNIGVSKEMVNYLLRVIGVQEEQVDPDGALAFRPYSEIAELIQEALEDRGYSLECGRIQEQLETLFNRSVTGGNAKFRALTNIQHMAAILKSRQIHIGLATADTIHSARTCLESLGVVDLFDYVGADDGIKKPKPEKDMFLEFQERFGLAAAEIAVVGDTYNDIVFAKKNGGVAIGVLSGVSSREDFQGEADYVIESIRQLPRLLEQMK